MKIRNLWLVVFILSITAGLAFWAKQREIQRWADVDPLLGKPLLAEDVIEQLGALEMEVSNREEDLRVVLEDGQWILPEPYGISANFSQLSRLIGTLRDAMVVRKITENPERIEDMGIGALTIRLKGQDDQALLSFSFGEQVQGGRFVQLDGDGPVYLVSPLPFINSNPSSWEDKSLLTLEPSDIQRFGFVFPDAGEILFRWEEGETPTQPIFTPSPEPELSGVELDQQKILNQWNRLRSLRFLSAEEKDHPLVEKASGNTVHWVVELADGNRLDLKLGQATREKTVEEGEENAAPPDKLTYLFGGSSRGDHPVDKLLSRLALQMGNFYFDGFPKSLSDLGKEQEATTMVPQDQPTNENTSSRDEEGKTVVYTEPVEVVIPGNPSEEGESIEEKQQDPSLSVETGMEEATGDPSVDESTEASEDEPNPNDRDGI